jgi:hypothetical protein
VVVVDQLTDEDDVGPVVVLLVGTDPAAACGGRRRSDGEKCGRERGRGEQTNEDGSALGDEAVEGQLGIVAFEPFEPVRALEQREQLAVGSGGDGDT